jgi:8-oxo-dGTP pyrophosphatase MutT (NUDIX family)
MFVASGIIERRGKFLAGKRKGYSDGYNGLYCSPGGKVETGESVEACMIREIKEETGLIVRNWVFIGVEYLPGFAIHFYLVLHYDGSPQLREPSKCEDWEWIDWAQPMTPGLELLRDRNWSNFQKLRTEHAKTLFNLSGCVAAQNLGEIVCGHPWCKICYDTHTVR